MREVIPRKPYPLLFALALWMTPALAGGTTDRLGEVLAEMKKAGDRLETLTASFVQTNHDFILKEADRSEGRLYLEVPGRIRFEYHPPQEKVLLIKDDLIRLYNPSAFQVQEFEPGERMKGSGADLLVGFGKSNERIGESYDASLTEETEEVAVLKLVPKPGSAASLFTAIDLSIDKKTWTPRRSVFHEPNRDYTVIEFDEVEVNGKLPEKIFELKLPPNVEIIR